MIPFPLTDVRILSQRVKEENERGEEEEETAELRIVMFLGLTLLTFMLVLFANHSVNKREF